MQRFGSSRISETSAIVTVVLHQSLYAVGQDQVGSSSTVPHIR
jgi:hypothetical protein